MSTIIEIDEVNKVFATGEHAVKNLSLNIKEGEIRKHITKMARYITEGIIDVIE